MTSTICKSGILVSKIADFYPRKALLSRLALPGLNQQPQVHSQVINKNMIIKSPGKAKGHNSKSPVVLLVGWMMSKEKHLEKYENIYLSQGFDVLEVRLTPLQLLFPSGTQIVAQQTANWLADHKEYTDIAVHGFSVGGFLYGEVMSAIEKNKNLQDSIIKRVRVQIFDSVVTIKGMQTAFPRALSSNPVLLKALELFTKTHMTLLKNMSVQHYENSYDMFCHHRFRVPTLVLMSKADKLGCCNEMFLIIKIWEAAGIKVEYKLWENSPHYSHYLNHPREYTIAMAQILESVGLLQDPSKIRELA